MDFSIRLTDKQLREWFAAKLIEISDAIGFKVSSRGWGYIMEQKGFITKDQFDKVEDAINRCRRKGYLPVDFVAEEASREFSQVHIPNTQSFPSFVAAWLSTAHNCHNHFEPDWWQDEEYYIQMVVEKIDLVSLFEDICGTFHIPIANSKGWSSILQRAQYCRRFKDAEDRGLKCVLLYCGDHDPDGLRISDTIRKNLEDLKDVRWDDGEDGYDPENLVIERFGLDYEFIQQNRLTWIDNLITGSGKNLADPRHANYNLPYLKEYLKKIGERKCEANAVVIVPEMGRQLCTDAIERYLGDDAHKRFEEKKERTRLRIGEIMDEVKIRKPLINAIRKLNKM
jgi:hypothetical protein